MKNEQNEERMRKYNCDDCGCRIAPCGARMTSFNVSYMLKDELWLNVNNGKDKGLLCLICAQLRLGRKFIPTDFKDVPINFHRGGALQLLFPVKFKDHQSEFVSNKESETTTYCENIRKQEDCYEENREELLAKQRKYRELRHERQELRELSIRAQARKSRKSKKSKRKGKKSKRGRPTKHSTKTKKGMADRRKAGKVITGPQYGWNKQKDGTVQPNWREQHVIEWMTYRVTVALPKKVRRMSASMVARILNENGYTGKRGGKWTPTTVLRTVRNNHHNTVKQYRPQPKWYENRPSMKDKVNPLKFKKQTQLLEEKW